MSAKSLVKFLKRNQLLVGLNGVLGVAFLWLFLSGSQISQNPVSETPEVQTQEALFVEKQAVTEDDPIYVRPIFHADRHPAKEKAAPAPVVAVAPFRLELTGVLSVSNEMGWAFFRDLSGQEAFQISLGETIDGWTLENLGDNEVTLSKDGAQKTLSLNNPLALGSVGANGQGTATPENPDQTQKPRTRKRK